MDFKFYLRANLICLGLVWNVNAAFIKWKSNLQQFEPCAMITGGSLPARNKIWERICKMRRTETNSEFASRERGPERTDFYNPTYGFEPYWQFGDWVFSKFKSESANGSVTEEVEKFGQGSCEVPCPENWSKYGPLCAMDRQFLFISFKSYCEMKSYDCQRTRGFTAIHRHRCANLITYPTSAPYVVSDASDKLYNAAAKKHGTTFYSKDWWLGGHR